MVKSKLSPRSGTVALRQLNPIHKNFLNVDIPNKIITHQYSWIRTLYDNSFHEWKLIPFYLIEKHFGNSFKFHSLKVIKRSFSYLSKEKMRNFDWKKRLAIKNEIPPNILSHLQYNLNIQVDKTFIQFSRFSEKYIHFCLAAF